MNDNQKRILEVLLPPVFSSVLTFGATYYTVKTNQEVEAGKISLAKAEAFAKFHPLLTSDDPRERDVAYEALKVLGYGENAKSLKRESLIPERLRIYIQTARQRKTIEDMANKLRVPQSAIYVARPFTKFSDGVEVRYFDEKDWGIAQHVASMVGPLATVRRGSTNTEKRGAIDIWVSEPIYETYTYDTPSWGGTFNYKDPKLPSPIARK